MDVSSILPTAFKFTAIILKKVAVLCGDNTYAVSIIRVAPHGLAWSFFTMFSVIEVAFVLYGVCEEKCSGAAAAAPQVANVSRSTWA